jgi:hypothetical protein
VKVWTAHLRDDAAPVLLRDAFCWGALFFGPIWLAAHRAFVPAALSLASYVLVIALVPEPGKGIMLGGLVWLHGLIGRDLCRWSMSQRGFLERYVLVGRSEVEALDRLLHERPELARRFAGDLT